MVYRDDPNDDNIGGAGGGGYRDDDTFDGDDAEFGIADVPQELPPSSGSRRGGRCKVLFGLCLLAALAIGGWEAKSVYYDGDDENGGNGHLVGKPLFVGNKKGSKAGEAVGGGVRGSDDVTQEEEVYETPAEEVVPVPVLPPPSEEEIVTVTAAPTSEPTTAAPTNKPTRPIITYHASQPNDACKDDPAFVHSNLKSCKDFVANVGRPLLLQSRCSQPVGLSDERGEELLVKHFCRLSCDMCNEQGNEEIEFAENLEKLEETESSGVIEEDQNVNNGGEVVVSQEEDAEAFEELAEEENELEETIAEFNEEMGIDDEETQVDIDLQDQPQDEEGNQDWDDDDEGEEEEVDEYLLEIENEELAIQEEDNLDSQSALFNHDSPGEEAVVPIPSLPEDALVAEQPADYFVPLTQIERGALKEKLREVLRITNAALLISTKMNSIPENMRNDVVPPQRTLVLNPTSHKQFMHLAQSQAGSEELDELVHCALNRQKDLNQADIRYNAIREGDNLNSCINDLANRIGAVYVNNEFHHRNPDGSPSDESFDPSDESLGIPDAARNVCSTYDASIMTYGASLNAVSAFDWKSVESIAMFANPVERTHQYYLAKAPECYKCKDFTDVLKEIKSGTFTSDNEYCTSEMIGHQGANLVTRPDLYSVANDITFPREQDIVTDAIRNLRDVERITWIGIKDDMEGSIAGFQQVFPWLAEDLSAAARTFEQVFRVNGDQIGDDKNFGLPADYEDRYGCYIDRQEVPYRCGSREVDSEALQLISQLNMRDLAVYRAAFERYQIQNEVLKEYHDSVGRK